MLRERKMRVGIWCGRMQTKAHLKDLDVELNVITKCTCNKYEVAVCTGFSILKK
jgi:hypothetical protein